MEELKVVKGTANSFYVTGRVKFKESDDKSFAIGEKTKTDLLYNSMNLSVDVDGERTYLNLFQCEPKKESKKKAIYANPSKIVNGREQRDYSQSIVVSWDKRFDEKTLEKINDQCFYHASVAKDSNGNLVKKKFLSAYDMIEYLSENLKDNDYIYCRGELSFEPLFTKDGQLFTRVKKNIKDIYITSEDNAPRKTFTLGLLTKSDFCKEEDLDCAIENEQTLKTKVYMPVRGLKVGDEYSKEYLAVPLDLIMDASTSVKKSLKRIVSKYFSASEGEVNFIEIEGEFKSDGDGSEITKEELLEGLDKDTKEALDDGLITIDELLMSAVDNNSRAYEKLFYRKTRTIKSQESNIPSVKFVSGIYEEDTLKMYEDEVVFEPEQKIDEELEEELSNELSDSDDEDLELLDEDFDDLFADM